MNLKNTSGPLVIAGSLVAAIVAGLGGAVVIGGTAIGAALYSIGIPNDSVLKYETAIKSDQFVLVVHGTAKELTNAKDILKSMGHDVSVHTA